MDCILLSIGALPHRDAMTLHQPLVGSRILKKCIFCAPDARLCVTWCTTSQVVLLCWIQFSRIRRWTSNLRPAGRRRSLLCRVTATFLISFCVCIWRNSPDRHISSGPNLQLSLYNLRLWKPWYLRCEPLDSLKNTSWRQSAETHAVKMYSSSILQVLNFLDPQVVVHLPSDCLFSPSEISWLVENHYATYNQITSKPPSWYRASHNLYNNHMLWYPAQHVWWTRISINWVSGYSSLEVPNRINNLTDPLLVEGLRYFSVTFEFCVRVFRHRYHVLLSTFIMR